MANDPQPLARPGRVHEFPSFFAPPPAPPGYAQALQPVVPDQLRGRPARAHELPYLFKPGRLVSPPAIQPVQPVTPMRLVGRAARAHEYQFLARPGKFVTPVAPAIPGVGVAGEATFVLSLQPGTKTSYGWQTSVFTSYSGAEQRESTIGIPRRRFEGVAFLLDAGMRDLSGTLQRAAALGSVFVLALPNEALTISADSPNSTVTVASTALCDWALPGQRAVILAPDGTTQGVIVQSATSTTIEIVRVSSTGAFAFGSLGSTGRSGGQIMPLVQVVLEPTQGLARYPVTVGMWSLRATAVAFGFAGVDSMGAGTELTTMTEGAPVDVADIVDDDVLIWDRVNAMDDTVSETMIARTEIVDMGGLPFAIGGAEHPDWGRTVKLRSSSSADFQWLKAFLHHVRGRQGAFLLSTNRADLIYDSTASGGFRVKSASVVGGNDYVSFFASESHRRLAVVGGGTLQYTTVTSVTDNADGTLTLTVDDTIAGAITKISFLEQVRLDSDDAEIAWDGAAFAFESPVVTVHEVVHVRHRFLFDVVLDTGLVTTNPYEFTGTFGLNTLIQFKANGTKFGTGITAAGGNVDGMLVCIVVDDSTGGAVFFEPESASSPPASRLRMVGAGLTIGAGACWFRYSGSAQRWLELMRST